MSFRLLGKMKGRVVDIMSKNRNSKKNHKELFLADKNSPFNYMEAYKTLRANLEFIASGSELRKIMVTSTIPNEQKTGVAINLSVSLADSGKKVCIVDCDLRKPTHHKLLKLRRHNAGLSSVLSGKAELSDVVCYVEGFNIYSVPSGPIPPNPSELLASDRMKAVVDDLSKDFDYVIFDTPPASIVSDAHIIGRITDGTLFAVLQNGADVRIVKQCKDELVKNGVRVLGAIMTGFNCKKSANYYNYYKDYSYSYGVHNEVS